MNSTLAPQTARGYGERCHCAKYADPHISFSYPQIFLIRRLDEASFLVRIQAIASNYRKGRRAQRWSCQRLKQPVGRRKWLQGNSDRGQPSGSHQLDQQVPLAYVGTDGSYAKVRAARQNLRDPLSFLKLIHTCPVSTRLHSI